MNAEIKPCPFCGGKAVLNKIHITGDKTPYFVCCRDCGASSSFAAQMDMAAKVWNRRKMQKWEES